MNEEEKLNQPTDDNSPSTEENKTAAEPLTDNLPDRQAINQQLIWKYIIILM